MDLLRTPEARFEGLTDWPFVPRYLTVEAPSGTPLRLHFVDERGARADSRPVLMLHGEPTWGYLYRHLIPLIAAHHRALALDFPGFGRSDKPASMHDVSYELMRSALVQGIERLDLTDITLVVHDWGGLVGLPVAALDVPERIGRLVILNTFLPTGEETPSAAFRVWRASVAALKTWLPVGLLMKQSLPHPSAETIAGYTAPFPSARYKAAVARWPLLVPTTPGTPVAAVMREAREALRAWDKPALILFSDNDPVLGGGDRLFERLLPGARSERIRGGGHFLQDTRSSAIAEHLLSFPPDD